MTNPKLIELWKKQGRTEEQIKNKLLELGIPEKQVEEQLQEEIIKKHSQIFDNLLIELKESSMNNKQKLDDFSSKQKSELIQSLQKLGLILENIFVEKVIEKIREPITTEEQREYQRLYRQRQILIREKKDREQRAMEQISRAMERRESRCFQCNKQIKVENPSYELKKDRKTGKYKIIVISTCPKCKNIVKSWGGYSDYNPNSSKNTENTENDN